MAKWLRLVYDNSRNLSFEELKMIVSVYIQKILSKYSRHRNLFKTKLEILAEIISDLFHFVKKPSTLEIITFCKGKKTKPFILAMKVSDF